MRKLFVIAIAMFGFGFALVPFYKKICEVTGVNNLIKADEIVNTQVDANRLVNIQFDSNLRNDLPWTFHAVQGSTQVHPGELTTITYEVHNNSSRAITGQAIPSYSPELAARYFKKVECFCFKQQTLQPHETREMPVVFLIDKEIPKDVGTILLSYTFFAVEGTAGQTG